MLFRSGTAASLAAVTRDDMVAFAKGRIARDNIKIGVVGDIDAATVAKLLDDTFGALPAKAAPAGTRCLSAAASISESARRNSSCSSPTALPSGSSERNELEHTSSASEEVRWASVLRTGRISWITTGTPQLLPSGGNREAAALDRRFFEDVHQQTVRDVLAHSTPVDGCRVPLGLTLTKLVPIEVSLSPDGDMKGIRIFEFDRQGVLLSFTQAAQGTFVDDQDVWRLTEVSRDEFSLVNGRRTELQRQHLNQLDWPSGITQDMVSVALLKPSRMGTIDLFQYIRHLQDNAQTAQRYEIEFWKKVFYPISCLVMVVLALPFAYLHFRSGNIASYVFVGVLIGISFFLLNNVFGYLGNLSQWAPWLAAAAPGLIYSVVSLGAFGWLVLRQ